MARKTDKPTDVVVIGAGPAGATTALLLARAGRNVTLLDSAAFPRTKVCAGWLSPSGLRLCGELDIDLRKLADDAVGDVRFFPADLAQCARPTQRDALGVIIDRTAFDERLVAVAKKAGVKLLDRFTVAAARAGEAGVEVESTEGKVESGRVAVLAAGVSQRLAAQIGVSFPQSPDDAVHVAHLVARISASSSGKSASRLTLIFDAERSGCCMIIEQPTRISATLYGRQPRGEMLKRLGEILHRLHKAGYVTDDLSREASKAVYAPAYRFNALAAESHVGKLTLVVGDAGGFYATVSHEGIYPAMWSATIAARVIDEALSAHHVQDVLMTFDREWRVEMADFLRPPNTDLPLLIPLVFTNQPMADRMGAAFFLGENI